MLKTITLENYRCYKKHEIEFKDLSIVVGKNNAGKSTLIEALRILHIVINRYQFLKYSEIPDWLDDIPISQKGVSPSLAGYEFVFENLFHKYGMPPSKITATFLDNSSILIYLGREGKIHAVLFDSSGNVVKSKGKAQEFEFSKINILPQITPLLRKEEVLNIDYIKRNLSSNLSSSHFRNQINVFPEYFDKFRDLAQKSWSGLRILSIDNETTSEGENELSLMVKDNGFVAEVAWMGHGLQMWLQLMWFLARTESNETIILDEPDVYMHPDLQRRLIRLLKNNYNQVIIATHSIEIISEVDPENILVINRNKPNSFYTSSFPAVQKIINNMGSINNLQLTKLWSSKKLLSVEGNDIKYIKQIQNKIFADSNDPFDTIPNMEIGGWGGWNYVIGSKMLLKNAGDENIVSYCILDSDYHLEEEIEQRYIEAKQKGVQLHIWNKKEIENYFIIPDAIFRLIKNNSSRANHLTLDIIKDKIDEIAESFCEDLMDGYSTQHISLNKGYSSGPGNKFARNTLKEIRLANQLLSKISGKNLISQLSTWSQKLFGYSISIPKIINEMKFTEIDSELYDVIHKIEKCLPFDTRINFKVV